MSAHVGYGIEITNEENEDSYEVQEILDSNPLLTVVRSRPEYTDEPNRAFVMLKSTVKSAGLGDNESVVELNLGTLSNSEIKTIEKVVKEFPETVINKSGWFLVDYYET